MMSITGEIAKTIMGEDPKDRIIEREDKNMKEKTTWEKIKNGIKRAITFVIDVLLFIPRALFHGLCNELTYLACKYVVKYDNCDDDDFEEISDPVVEVKAEQPLTKEARQQAKAERKEAKAAAKEEKREAKAAAKEERKEAKAAAKEAKVARKTELTTEVIEEAKAEDTQVVEEVKAEATTEVIEEAKAEDTQVVEEAKAEEMPAVAAGDVELKAAMVPESVVGEVVETTPAEVVETNQNASNTTVDANDVNNVSTAEDTKSCNHEHSHVMKHEHICELRKDDIGFNELIAIDNYLSLIADKNAYDPGRNFVHFPRFSDYTLASTHALLTAWCERLGIQTGNMTEDFSKYGYLISQLASINEIDEEEKGVLEARACNYLCMMGMEAERQMKIYYQILCKYFKKFYGSWVLYNEFDAELIKVRQYFSSGQMMPRLSVEEANKYFPIDESLKGITMAAPFGLADFVKQC